MLKEIGRSSLVLLLAFPFFQVYADSNKVFKIKRLTSGQGAIGLYQVNKKVKEYQNRREIFLKKELYEKDGSPRISVVLGPNKMKIIFDGNHHAYAAKLLGYKKIPVKIVADLSGVKSEKAFLAELIAKKYVRLKDKNGDDITLDELPNLSIFNDDPSRSAINQLIDEDYLSKKKVKREGNFAEFILADQLKEVVPMPSDSTEASYLAYYENVKIYMIQHPHFLQQYSDDSRPIALSITPSKNTVASRN